jgi:hypothetical protein
MTEKILLNLVAAKASNYIMLECYSNLIITTIHSYNKHQWIEKNSLVRDTMTILEKIRCVCYGMKEL